ncbi:hypothetical protein GCM10022243_64410 [Saccharothrix violaceirubra]|uniref:Uncharacterized protein n=1 Tax=Saccharothrix violaceirubra TaxID=413306 RepID=A0A7W7T9L2_9PSEU|nr:hypothetical protein [Saccharothrix violaceirubra]MBB4969074.1 hypothetical protein [Saccharothrix violaceirubra]
MSDRFIAWLRTVVPVAWSALVAWLISLGAPDYLTNALGGAAELLVVPVLVGVVYPIARKIEARLPDWLTRVLLGSAKPPIYPGTRPPSDG